MNNLKDSIMGDSFKMKCPNCGALLKINETGELFPGGKDHEEACCPKCHHEVYSAMTSGFVKAFEISEDEFNE